MADRRSPAAARPSNGGPAPGGGPGEVVLRLTRAELLVLAASVNEAIEAVEDWEFPARLGAGKAHAAAAPLASRARPARPGRGRAAVTRPAVISAVSQSPAPVSSGGNWPAVIARYVVTVVTVVTEVRPPVRAAVSR